MYFFSFPVATRMNTVVGIPAVKTLHNSTNYGTSGEYAKNIKSNKIYMVLPIYAYNISPYI